MRFLCIGEDAVEGGWDVVTRHEVFGKGFGAFELRGGFGRAENRQSFGAKCVHHTFGQRRFGAHHGQVNGVGLGKLHQCGVIHLRDVGGFRQFCRAGIARRDKHRLDFV